MIAETDLHVTEEEIVENLKEQNDIEARIIKIYCQNEKISNNQVQIPIKHITLTFNMPNLWK